jgi:Arc/MetJ-type ribon-helix-helix transcriptional regulator
MTRIVTLRVPDEQADAVDALVAAGAAPSRTAAYLAAIDAWLHLAETRRLDEAIVAGYRRLPPTPEEITSAAIHADRSVDAEPW